MKLLLGPGIQHGVVTTQGFNPQTGLLTSIAAGSSGAVQSFAYTYDALGNLLTRVDNDNAMSESFTYDGLNRVLTASVTSGPSKSFSYDAVGDILTKSDVGTYTYPAAGSAQPHAVQSISGTVNTSFSYDADGNLTSGEGRTITYSAANAPISITQGTKTVAFSLDPDHQRFKQVSNSGDIILNSWRRRDQYCVAEIRQGVRYQKNAAESLSRRRLEARARNSAKSFVEFFIFDRGAAAALYHWRTRPTSTWTKSECG